MSWKLTWTSCTYADQPNNLDPIIGTAPKAHWMLGDHHYYQWGYSLFGITTPEAAVATAPSVWLQKADQLFSHPSWQKFHAWAQANGVKRFLSFDDHGLGGSNWDHTVARAQENTPIGASTLADVLTHWRNAVAGFALIRAKYSDDPATGEPNGNIPSAMVGTASAADYRTEYFYTDFAAGGVLLDVSRALPSAAVASGRLLVRVIKVDGLSYKNPRTDTDNSSKEFLGVAQTQWVKDVLADARTAGAKVVLIASDKDLFNVDNADGWYNYSNRRDNLLQWIHDNNHPVAGWIVGDRHYWHVGQDSAARGGSYDALCVCACPFGVAQSSQLGFYTRNLAAQATKNFDQRVFGVVEIDEERQLVRFAIRDVDKAHDDPTGDLDVRIVPFGARKSL